MSEPEDKTLKAKSIRSDISGNWGEEVIGNQREEVIGNLGEEVIGNQRKRLSN